MRAFEFIKEERRVPPMSLRHINRLKKDQEVRQASFARRDAILPFMYGNPAKELERIDLEKAYIELAQLQAELENTKAEAGSDARKSISKLARSVVSGLLCK